MGWDIIFHATANEYAFLEKVNPSQGTHPKLCSMCTVGGGGEAISQKVFELIQLLPCIIPSTKESEF